MLEEEVEDLILELGHQDQQALEDQEVEEQEQ
jgi:hypothetical protein